MNPILTKIKGWWNAATPIQRLTTLGGTALTLVIVAMVFSYAGKPKFTMLYGGLNSADQAGIVSEIQLAGVPVQYDATGTVEVPADKVADVKMRLATAGKLPKSSHPDIGDLNSMNAMLTPGVERERLRSIAEGELAKSIETIPGIQSARVHITLGDDSPFGSENRRPTASVNVVQGGTILTGEQAQGIAMLVSNAVNKMSIQDVVVLNERMEPIFNGSDSVGTEHLAEKKLDLEQQVGKSEERKLQSALDTMFGPGSTLVTVRAEVDLDDEESTISSHKVKDGAEVETAIEKAPMGGDDAPLTPAGGASNGMDPSAPAAKASATGGGTYTNKVSRMEPGTTDTVTRRKKATGGLRRMLINVAANTGKFKDEAEGAAFVQSIDTFVRNEFKTQSDTTSFQAFVTPVKFDTSAQEIAEKAQDEVASSAKRQQIISLLPIGALLIVGLFVVKSLGKIGKAAIGGLTPALAGAGASLPGGGGTGEALSMGSGYAMPGGTAGLPGSSGSPLENALSGHFGADGLLGLPEGARRTEDGGIEFESDDERIRITKIKERTSIPLEQIRQMSTERPEAVAMLVKTWLMDEKR